MGINIEAEVHGNRSGERKIVKIGPNLNVCYTVKTPEIIHCVQIFDKTKSTKNIDWRNCRIYNRQPWGDRSSLCKANEVISLLLIIHKNPSAIGLGKAHLSSCGWKSPGNNHKTLTNEIVSNKKLLHGEGRKQPCEEMADKIFIWKWINMQNIQGIQMPQFLKVQFKSFE